MPTKSNKPTVFFNASVVLAGLYSPQGGSGKLLRWCQQGKLTGIISEIVLDEVSRNLGRLNLSADHLHAVRYFQLVSPPPEKVVGRYYTVVLHRGDAHLLASAIETTAQYLVSLDQKHILSLKRKIRKPAIVSPKELILQLEKRKEK